MHSEQVIRYMNKEAAKKANRQAENRKVKEQIQANVDKLVKSGKVKITKHE